MITTTGVRLYRWYRQGVTEIEDLQWLLEFYDQQRWSRSVVGFALMEAVRYFEQ